MSTVYLVPDDPSFDVIGFDVTTGEQHTEVSTLTANPIEDGSIVNDHIIHEPASFSFAATVSNHPIKTTFYGDGLDGVYNVDVPRYGGRGVVIQAGFLAQGFVVERVANRVLEMQERLTRLRLAGATVSILTSTKTYDKMAIVQVALPRGPKTIGRGDFTIDLAQVRIVQTQTVRAPKPKEKRGIPGQAVAPGEPQDKAPKRNTSALRDIIDRGPTNIINDAAAQLGFFQ